MRCLWIPSPYLLTVERVRKESSIPVSLDSRGREDVSLSKCPRKGCKLKTVTMCVYWSSRCLYRVSRRQRIIHPSFHRVLGVTQVLNSKMVVYYYHVNVFSPQVTLCQEVGSIGVAAWPSHRWSQMHMPAMVKTSVCVLNMVCVCMCK